MLKKKYVCQWIWLVVCVITVVIGGIYYFGILHAFVPNAEDLMNTQRWYLILHYGQSYHHNNLIFDIVSCLSVLIGGMSYFSARLEFAIFYMIVLGLSLYLSVVGKRGEKRWFLLPMLAFIMVFIHTAQSGSAFLRMYEDIDLICFFPYNYHIMSLIFALLSMVLLQCCMTAAAGKRRSILGCVGIVVGGYALLYTDLIYYVIFVCPLIIVLVLRGLYHDKARKYVILMLTAGVAVLLLTRILPGEAFGKLWGTEAVGDAYGDIYGATNWLSLDNLFLHVTNYIKTIMILFNIELSDRPIISFYSVLFVVRIAFVVIGYMVVAKIVAGSVRGKAEQNGYTMIDEILAWGFVVLSCAYIFTRNALYRDLMRYYAALVPFLTILICRHICSFMREFLPVLENIKHKRFYFAGIIGAMCICQAEPVWTYELEDSYLWDCETTIEYLRQWGAEEVGYALAPYWLGARLSAMTHGEIIFFANEQQIREIYGEEAEIRYIVVGWDDRGLMTYSLNHIAYGSYEEMCEKYKAPLRAVDLDYVYVCEFGE